MNTSAWKHPTLWFALLLTLHSAAGAQTVVFHATDASVNRTALSAEGPKIYWTAIFGPTVRRADPDGANVETVVNTGGGVGIAVDAKNQKIYWTDDNALDIRRSDLDGANMEILVPHSIAINPRGIDLDVDDGKMYWTDEFTPIRRANLDGSHIEDLLQVNQSPTGIALDISSGKMYWQELFSRKIRRANLDGSNAEDLLDAGFGAILVIGLALDLTSEKMYWADLGNDKIMRANLDGSQEEEVITTLPDSAFNPAGIALDVNAGKVYWTASGPPPDRNWRVQRANLDGSSPESVFVSPLFDEVLQDIAFVPEGRIQANVDIKPGASPNSINPASRGVIPVAILTTDAFDATTVDALSVRFGPQGAPEAHRRGHIEDVNGDSRLDFVLHFRTDKTGIKCGDTGAKLTGATVMGSLIEGQDSLFTVGCR